jgi:hypothetical protein
MKAPLKSALLGLAALLAALSFAPVAQARGVAEVSAAEVAAPAPRLARQRQREQRERRQRTPRPAPAPVPSLAPAPAPQPEPEPEPAPQPAPESAPGAEPAPAPTPDPDPVPSPVPAPKPLLEAGFESGLSGWSTAGLGEATPTAVSDIVRSGSHSGRFLLGGSQNRSELILGGNGTGSTSGAARFYEGDEYWYGFSFYIESMVYGRPGAHNLIMQFKSADSGSPAFGLMLWDYKGNRGLWSHGAAMDGDCYLAAAAERQWHDVAIRFKASGSGKGLYELYFDGTLVDSRSGVSTIVPGSPNAYVKNGLYRDGGDLSGTADIRLDAARLGTSLAAVSG